MNFSELAINAFFKFDTNEIWQKKNNIHAKSLNTDFIMTVDLNTEVNLYDFTLVEQVRLCAEAMGIKFWLADSNTPENTIRIMRAPGDIKTYGQTDCYWPIANKSQAFDLMQRFMLVVDNFAGSAKFYSDVHPFECWSDDSINHAIVETVVRKQLMFPSEQSDLLYKENLTILPEEGMK